MSAEKADEAEELRRQRRDLECMRHELDLKRTVVDLKGTVLDLRIVVREMESELEQKDTIYDATQMINDLSDSQSYANQNRNFENAPLPPGWQRAYNDTGKMYYVNHSSKTTQWVVCDILCFVLLYCIIIMHWFILCLIHLPHIYSILRIQHLHNRSWVRN